MLLALWSALLSACSTPPACAPLEGVDALLTTRVVLVGEVHGTAETPALAGDIVCHALQSGKSVVLAIEHPTSGDAGLGAALETGDRAALLTGPFWHLTDQDGRTSAAMADLVLRAHDWKQAGKPIEVVGFDVEPSPAGGQTPENAGPGARDKNMAGILGAVIASHPTSTVVVLTGNIHARRTPGVPWDPTFQTMGSRLEGPVVSVLARAVNGSAWNCQSDGCMERTFGDASAPAAPHEVHRYDQVTDGYDAEVELGRFTASLPAIGIPPAP